MDKRGSSMRRADLTPCHPGLEVGLGGSSPFKEMGDHKWDLLMNSLGKVSDVITNTLEHAPNSL